MEKTKEVKKWFTSDTHAFHKKIIEFTNRGKETTQEHHEEWLLDLINSKAEKQDILYLLGDVAFAKGYDSIADWVSKINAQVIIVEGNHDNSSHLRRLVKDGLIVTWDRWLNIKIKDHKTMLCHFPMMSWNEQRYGSWHLHGHSHGNLGCSKGLMLDVGVDNSYNLYGKHQIFSEQDIFDYMQQQEVYVADLHREYKEK